MKRSCFFHRWVLGGFFYASTSLVWLFSTALVSATLILNLQGLALPMLLPLPQYTPRSGASWALLQETRFFGSSPPYFPFFLSSSVVNCGRYCLSVLMHPPCCAASTLHTLHEAAEDGANSTSLLMSWACPALSCKVCLHPAYVYANVYWAEASLMACNTVFCSFILQLFALQKLHCGNWLQAASGRRGNLPIFLGPFYISVLHVPCCCWYHWPQNCWRSCFSHCYTIYLHIW